MDNAASGLIVWAVAARTLAGQKVSGDNYWVKQNSTHAWLAVIDGAGHGSEAARASQIAMTVLEKGVGKSPEEVLRCCHEELRLTRGAVISLAEFSATANTMTWLGVGNVEGILLRRDAQGPAGRELLLLRPGVLGARLPSLRATVLGVKAGDTLIFATDGIREGFAEGANRRDSPQRIADGILNVYGRQTDDALVLVARYLDGNPDGTIR